MDRDKILTRKSLPHEITLENGDVFHIRKLSQGQSEEVKKKYGNDEKALEGLRYLFCQCVVDEQGNRLLTDSDMHKLLELDAEIIRDVATEVMRISGLLKDPKKS